MKKILSVLVCLILSFSVFAFAGCDSAPQDLSALEKKIAALEDKLGKVEKDNAALEDKLGKVEKDNAALEDMLGKVPDYKAEIDTLKATVTTLTQTIETLKTALDSLGTANTELSTALKKLETDLDKANARILILEGINSGENAPVVYEVGVAGKDTFTFINNGINLFTVTLVEYVSERDGYINHLKVILTNLAMANNLQIQYYFNVVAYSSSQTFLPSTFSEKTASVGGDSVDLFLTFKSSPTKDLIDYFMIGLPNQAPSSGSIIPYAQFI